MLLRGAQTLHELLARSERLASFSNTDDVRHHLDRLIARQPALVEQIPRGPGQREDRYVHLLSGAVDAAAVSARIVSSSPATVSASPALEARVQALEQQVAELRAAMAALTQT